MHRENRQPKTKATVPVPDDLRDFVRYVHQVLETRDPSARIKPDDFFQCERAYCVPSEVDDRRYRWAYFPEDTVRHQWEFDLDLSQIDRVADGTQAELTLWGCQQPGCRCKFSAPDATCFHCDYVEDDSGPANP